MFPLHVVIILYCWKQENSFFQMFVTVDSGLEYYCLTTPKPYYVWCVCDVCMCVWCVHVCVMCACVRACVHAWLLVHACMHVCACICACVSVCAHVCVCLFSCVFAHLCVCVVWCGVCIFHSWGRNHLSKNLIQNICQWWNNKTSIVYLHLLW